MPEDQNANQTAVTPNVIPDTNAGNMNAVNPVVQPVPATLPSDDMPVPNTDPVATPAPAVSVPTDTAIPSQEVSMEPKIKIVLVEDEALLLRMYEKKLQDDGYEVFTATNGEEGFKLIVDNMPAVVLCDIMMPGTNGLQLLEMKSTSLDENVKQIPVIMLTNLSGDEYSNKAMELGAISYIVKNNVQPGEVVAKVKEILAAHGQIQVPAAVAV